MTQLALRAEGIGKRYRVGRGWAEPKPTLGGRLVQAVSAPIRNFREVRRLTQFEQDESDDVHWALRDVSFEIRHGEVVGVIGRNGAGKSTLLKVLSRITSPTKGRALVHGRVGSLLEVGTGFHPDLTGRENIYLNGAVLGMDRDYVDRRFDEIVDFSGVEKFIDTPVKRYSSGMYLRLAFAVAAHLEAEIMIVDEVLAVGDAQFQKKCIGKMSSVGAEGRTVLFVSHNLTAVRTLCQRALVLRKGRLAADLSAAEAVEQYVAEISDSLLEQTWPDDATAPKNVTTRIRRVALRAADGSEPGEITTATPLRVDIDYDARYEGAQPAIKLTLYDLENNVAFETFNNREPEWYGRPMPAETFRSSCLIPGNLLNAQGYVAEITMYSAQYTDWYILKDVLRFEVSDSSELRNDYFREYLGAVRPDLRWTTARLGAPVGG
jgi:lipopolysaccharide transport system ATP-binding protein